MFYTTEYTPGDRVRIIAGGVTGVVDEICIDRHVITYEVQWWTDSVLSSARFYDEEITAEGVCNPSRIEVVRA